MAQDRIKIELHGALRVTGPNGQNLTPRAQKTQALVALLATARDLRRSRAWIQDKLWSDRAAKQASGSLRQAVHDLKKQLGDQSDSVRTDHAVIAFDPDMVVVTAPSQGPLSEVEFLSGIDVRDQEFSDWLRDMRAYFANQRTGQTGTKQGQPKTRLRIFMAASDKGEQHALILESVFLDSVRRTIAEFFDADFQIGLPDAQSIAETKELNYILRVQAICALSNQRFIRASLENANNLRSYWSQTIPLPADPNDDVDALGSHGLANQCVAALMATLDQHPQPRHMSDNVRADLLAATALRRMFTMRPEEIEAAEDLLSTAIEIAPRGLYHAWQAQALTIRHVEQQSTDADALREQVDSHVRAALQLEPMNSNVLSAAANARLIFGDDILQASALARQSVSLNRDNPLSWFAWANANLYGGEMDIAYAASVTAQKLGERTTMEFWTSFQRALSAAVTGNLQEALAYTAVSHALAPNFRPPLRYLAGIASRMGRMSDAARAIERLRHIEADFSIDRILNDPAYPVSMMRRAALIEPARIAELG